MTNLKKKRQAGFNLVEILVALVILSLGLLGIAGLQLMGVRANQGSYFRSQATSIMMDAAERMHNNLPGVEAGSYAGFSSTTNGCATPANICAQENGGAVPTGCTPQQMAVYDRFVLTCGMRGAGTARVDRIIDQLPGGTIRIDCIDNATPAVVVAAAACQSGFRHRVTVSWVERAGVSTTNPQDQIMERQNIMMDVQP